MNDFELEAIDGLSLAEPYRSLLRPGELVQTGDGVVHSLPRYFYAVPSWAEAHQTRVAAHFKLSELMMVDCREAAPLLRDFPHYVPCAIVLLARYLEDLRREADAIVFVGANGGYRSPAHQRSRKIDAHSWATAADVYRVGDSYLNDGKTIGQYAEIARSLGPQVFVRPYAEGDDHLHLDLGFITVTPREMNES